MYGGLFFNDKRWFWQSFTTLSISFHVFSIVFLSICKRGVTAWAKASCKRWRNRELRLACGAASAILIHSLDCNFRVRRPLWSRGVIRQPIIALDSSVSLNNPAFNVSMEYSQIVVLCFLNFLNQIVAPDLLSLDKEISQIVNRCDLSRPLSTAWHCQIYDHGKGADNYPKLDQLDLVAGFRSSF